MLHCEVAINTSKGLRSCRQHARLTHGPSLHSGTAHRPCGCVGLVAHGQLEAVGTHLHLWPACSSRSNSTPCACNGGRLRRQHPCTRHVSTASAASTAAGATIKSRQIETLAGDLPIRECLQEVLDGLERRSCMVLQAPPGAGKTTVVPLALLKMQPAFLRDHGTIMVLEPRRVAAKSAARRMASLLGERVGETVGYRVRLDSRVGPRTRIEVVTDGILLKRLQQDPTLEGVGAVLFDEFHERNLDSDLALALCLDAQSVARLDLRLLVMSATLGGGLAERIASLMATTLGCEASEVPSLASKGRSYPVETKYLGEPLHERGGLERAVADAVLRALANDTTGGDVLCFLPGVGEIRSVQRLLEQQKLHMHGVRVLPLHGNLAPEQQDEAIRGGAGRGRRVILSTPIAESSVTIDAVRAVVDSGLRRAPVFDTRTGVNRLQVERISAASADQRRGRAGRTGPGTCYCLWEPSQQLIKSTPPEILDADLTPLVLDLAIWGDTHGSNLPWLDPPPAQRVEAAVELLQELGALDDRGRITEQGQQMARFGVHPRFAHMLLRGSEWGAQQLAAVVAALLSERDLLRGLTVNTADIAVRLKALAVATGDIEPGILDSNPIPLVVDRAAAHRVVQGARDMLRQLCWSPLTTSSKAVAGEAPSDEGSEAEEYEEDADEVVGAASTGLQGVYSEGTAAPASPSLSSSLSSMSLSSSAAAAADKAATEARGALLDMQASGGMAGTSRSSSSSSSSKGKGNSSTTEEFYSAWTSQLLKDGLVGALVALAYPDRIARRKERSNKRAGFTLASGQIARLPIEGDPLGLLAEFLAIAELGGGRKSEENDNIWLAASLTSSAIERYLATLITERLVVFWASGSKSVLARRQKRLGALVLQETAMPIQDEDAVPALLQGFKEMGGVRGVGLPKGLEAWRQRVCWLRRHEGGDASNLPDLSDEALLATAKTWLVPHLVGAGVRSKADFANKLNWDQILRGMVSWQDAARVEQEAPSHVELPMSRVALDYSRDQPTISMRIQEVFGLVATPRLAGGRVPILMELLSPAQRPLQVTADLAGFWKTSYSAVYKEMKGRYPKHYWPEDPSVAEPTNLTKKKMLQQQQQQQQQTKAGKK